MPVPCAEFQAGQRAGEDLRVPGDGQAVPGGGLDGPGRHWRRLGWGWLVQAGQAGERGDDLQQQRVDAGLLDGGAAGAELRDRAAVPGLGGELAGAGGDGGREAGRPAARLGAGAAGGCGRAAAGMASPG